jgi:glycosyltransferase involved in cell wall biosynthesis
LQTLLRIIHIVENLDKGAVENWLVNIFLSSRKTRPDWHWTFYCILGKEGRLDEKVREAGGEIIYSPVIISHKISFLRHLRSVLKNGSYDIIHAHHDYLSGFYLLASAGIRFKKRILQIHNTDKALPVGNPHLHQVLLGPFRKLCFYFSDLIVGISEDTLIEFTGGKKLKRPKFKVLYYGIDLRRFEDNASPAEFRSNLGIPEHSKILLFVGRMNELKNPVYIIEILVALLKSRNDVYGVFVGKGDQEAIITKKAAELGIANHIRLLGWHDNISGIMKNADVFVFPRNEFPKEGLGLVVVEAQAAGLPMFITKGIVQDAIILEELAFYTDLNDPLKWSEKISAVLNNGAPISRKEALAKMKQSKFELNIATGNFVNLYEN